MNISLLRKRVLEAGVAVPAIALLSVAAPAFAQDATPARADTCDKTTDANCQETNTTGAASDVILVTGSILGRTDTETPSPVTVLSTEELENRGVNTVAEGLQRLSANGSGAISEGWNNGNNFAAGANAVSLRGLTVQNTLTVFDGLRMAPYPLADDGHRNFVDLNTIPDVIVDRVEVLKDGASSTYGADAVAGVVNLITKKEIQGVHLNMSGGLSQEGDGAELRADGAVGYGDLEEKGFNIYLAGTYRKSDVVWARDRDYPFNTGNIGGICEGGAAPSPTVHCMAIPTRWYEFGVNANGTIGGSTLPDWPLVAPGNGTGGRTGEYRLLNPDCAQFGANPIQLPNSARQFNTAGTIASWAVNQCTKDTKAAYATLRPDSERYGFAARATVKVGESAEAYIEGNYMHVHTYSQLTPRGYVDSTTPSDGGAGVTLNPVQLPVYVCAQGVGSFSNNTAGGTGYNISTGCTTATGAPVAGAVLNPNNPFAAQGITALVRGRYPFPSTVETNARSLRGAAGINGTFGSQDEWHYQVDFTASQVQLVRISENYPIPQRLADVIAKGTWNFAQPWLNSQQLRDYVAPVSTKTSTSDLWQASGILSRSLFELPGGALQAAVGAAYRHEAINDDSANPGNIAHPWERYFGVNAVGAVGSRNVWSAFYEINAPILDSLEVNASGRYDDYSSGQTNFSPKFGAKFKPIEQVLLRGTWSKGFRIPSFNESFGLPTTGYTTLSVNCTTYAAFCNAHGNNNYATGQYQLGRTSIGNPALAPEKSTSWTAGVVIEPFRNFSFTVDYFNITTNDVIANISAEDQDAALGAFLATGNANAVPGVTVIGGPADPQFPNAPVLPAFIQYSFQNADTQKVSGLDFGLNYKHNFGDIRWNSSIDASYILDYKIVRKSGAVEDYEGTLSPCDYTSCSGTPQLRANWSNTFGYGPFNLNVTAYYTEGYDLASVDYGGVKGDCANNVGASVVAYNPTTAELALPVASRPVVPVQCVGEETWNVDLTMNYEINDNATVYLNVLNVLGLDAPFDPSAAYSIFQYNPTWAQPNIMGRYFRIGAKVDF